MQGHCEDSVLRMIDIMREPLRPLRRIKAPLEVCVDTFVQSALKSSGVWWWPQKDWAQCSSRGPTAGGWLAPYNKCQAPRWAIVITAVHPQGTFNLGGCAVNNREPKKGADYAEEPSQVEIANKKFSGLLQIQNSNKIHLMLSFPHRVLLACPVVLHPKNIKAKSGSHFPHCTQSRWVSLSKWDTFQKQQITHL